MMISLRPPTYVMGSGVNLGSLGSKGHFQQKCYIYYRINDINSIVTVYLCYVTHNMHELETVLHSFIHSGLNPSHFRRQSTPSVMTNISIQPCFAAKFQFSRCNFPNFHSQDPSFFQERKMYSLDYTFGNLHGTHTPTHPTF